MGGRLPDRLVEEDHARDELLGPLRGEEQLAIRAPVLLSGLDSDRVEALLDRSLALVRGKDSLALRDERFRSRFELLYVHFPVLLRSSAPSIIPQRLG